MNSQHITDYLQQHAKLVPDKPALVFEGQTLTWSELWQQVETAANCVAGVVDSGQQQVVTLLLPNSVEFVIAYLAVVHAGHIALPLDPAYKKLELDAIIEQIPPRLIITNEQYHSQIGHHEVDVMLFHELTKAKKSKVKLLRLPADQQVASLTFTSGTTGTPKAVPNTHANHIWNIEVCSQVWDWTHQDNLLISVPLSHMIGNVMGLSGAIYHGNTLYLQKWFDETATLEALASGRISFFTHAASAYVKLIQAPNKGYDLSKVRLWVSGAAPLPPAVWQEFKARFGVEIVETYGSTETGRIAANSLKKRVLGSPGKILPGVDMKLSPEGEVTIKSPGVFPGYYHNPRATKEATAPDGYWRTGDIGELRNGYLFLKGRVQEKIRRYGYTISPRDIEWAMHQHPRVKDIYVMGRQRPDQPDDELVYFIVSSLSEKAIRDYCKQNLIFVWRPDRIIHLHDIPRTRSGKPQLAVLKKMTGARV